MAVTLTVHTDNPESLARACEVLSRAATGLVLELGIRCVDVAMEQFDPEDAGT